MDSCVTAAIARDQGMELAFLHINYGQRTESRELAAFNDIASHYGVEKRLVVDISHLRKIGGSALTDPNIPVPEGMLDRQGIPVSYVPFRNANLLAIATSWAEVMRARYICIGAVEEDGSGYPDCRGTFFRAFNAVIREGTKPGSSIEILTPLLAMNKKAIVSCGAQLQAPFHLSWSCYQREDVACGACDSCLLRLRGFREAGVPDPIPYANA
jgi:7-cyano-7-deazaguanine synthase